VLGAIRDDALRDRVLRAAEAVIEDIEDGALTLRGLASDDVEAWSKRYMVNAIILVYDPEVVYVTLHSDFSPNIL
ncbi:hypothetical protein, partial [Acinetobacter baumannii]|uniref:hypothetical protein n=1 Tax=Acinetobacter baumannii TaxID=470 RepID=UPI0037D934E4